MTCFVSIDNLYQLINNFYLGSDMIGLISWQLLIDWTHICFRKLSIASFDFICFTFITMYSFRAKASLCLATFVVGDFGENI